MIGELAALGAAFLWTLSAALNKVALLDAKPISANISRCISTTIFFLTFLGVSGKLLNLAILRTDSLLLASLSGVFVFFFGDTLNMASLALIGVSRAYPISCSYPLFTLLFAALFLGERITPFLLLGTLVIVVGIWLISQQTDAVNDLKKSILFKGAFVALVSALFTSVGVIFLDNSLELSQMAAFDTVFVVNTARMGASTILFLAFSPLIDRKFSFIKLKEKTWVILALSGIIAVVLGGVLFSVSFLYIETSRAVSIGSVSPLFAILIGAFFLKEKVTLQVFVGSILIALGTFILFAL